MKYLMILTMMLPVSAFAGAHFDTGSSKPTKELIIELKKVYDNKIKGKDVKVILVEAHTDSRGNVKYNQKLSELRAKAVADQLVNMGVKRSQIETKGKGKSEQLNNGTTDDDYAKNRRVVIVVKYQDDEVKTIISESKECKPVVIDRGVREIQVKKHKHILSLTVNRSLTDYDISSPSYNSTKVENRFELAPGIMYQNNITNDVYLGIQVDTHKSVGGSIGYGW